MLDWEMLRSPDTFTAIHQICLIISKFVSMTLKRGLRICSFSSVWLCLIIKVLAIWVKFLELSGYCTVINYAFTFYLTNIFGYLSVMDQLDLIKHNIPHFKSQYEILAFRSHSKTMYNMSTTTILPITAGTFYSFNYFGHVIYVPHTNMY